MSSKRLPGKNLKPILGRPMLGHLLERLKRCQMLNSICVATSVDSSDDVLKEFSRTQGVECYRGSLDDVLDRTLNAARFVEADVIVEITGDCPLIDANIVDAAIRRYLRGDCDYVANILDRLSFPIGFDVQVYSTNLLDEVSGLTNDPFDRGNVTPYIYRNPQRYRLLNLYAPPALDRPNYFLCVDYQEDFEVVTAIYEALYPTSEAFTARDIICLLDDRPDLAARNYRPEAFVFPSAGGIADQEVLYLDD